MVLCGEKRDDLLWLLAVQWMVQVVKGQSMMKDGCEWIKNTGWGWDGSNGSKTWHEVGVG